MIAINLLAFDFGASGGRVILGRLCEGKLSINTVHRFDNGPIERSGRLHWDFPMLLAELKRGISLACRQAGGPIESLGIDTWGVDFGLLDSSGALIDYPYHYRDSRFGGMCGKAFETVPAKEIYEATGIAFLPFNTIYQLLAVKTHAPDLLHRAETMLMMPDLLAYHLTGAKASEFTIASTSQLLDANSGTWSTSLIDKFQLPERIFTDIEQPGSIRARLGQAVCEELGVGCLPVVAVASHDTASAVVAVPFADDSSAYLSAGTWSLLGMEVDRPVTSDQARKWNFTNEGGTDGCYRLLRNISGMWILQECRRQWDAEGRGTDYDELVALAAGCESPGSLVDGDDKLFAEPGHMPAKIGLFCKRTGQTPPEGIGQTVRCILESLALKYRWVLDRLELISGRRVSCLHIVGGGGRNELLNRFTASAINRLVICGPIEATAVGNMMMQARALGYAASLQESRRIVEMSFPTRRYEPEDPSWWDQAYERFEKIMDQSPDHD